MNFNLNLEFFFFVFSKENKKNGQKLINTKAFNVYKFKFKA